MYMYKYNIVNDHWIWLI